MTRQLVTVEQIAAEHRIPQGRAIYMMHQPDAPRPVERKRTRQYDRAEVALYLRAVGVVRC